MHLARAARPAHFLAIALALLALLAALAAPGRLHAEAPAGVVEAAQADLAERLGGDDPSAYAVLRSEAVTWSDYCLGIYEPDIACATAQVDGFALWLSDGTVAYRYHTDATGTAVRLAESGIPLGEVAGAPLPDPRSVPPPPPEPLPADTEAPAGVVEAAQADLAERLGGAHPPAYAVLRTEAVTWSDYCLGGYEPDIACATALASGFVLWLSDGEVAYRYHTDATGAAVRLAESGIPLDRVAGAPLPEGQVVPPDDEPAPPPPPARIPDDAFEAAQADLAERLGGDDPAAYTVLRAEALTWRDGCLGVSEPDGVCTTALVDGFAVWLSDGEVAYRYHTDDTGTAVRLAESGIPLGQVAGAPLPEGHIEPPPDAPQPDEEPAPQPDDEPGAAAGPEGLPASGSGGLADSDVPAWVWGVIGAVAAAAVATGALYRLWLSRRH